MEYESDSSDKQNSSASLQERKCVLDLDIPYKIYFKIKPINIQYGENKKINYSVLKLKTNIIFDEMFKNFELPYSFLFKWCKIYSTSNDNYLKIFSIYKENEWQKIFILHDDNDDNVIEEHFDYDTDNYLKYSGKWICFVLRKTYINKIIKF